MFDRAAYLAIWMAASPRVDAPAAIALKMGSQDCLVGLPQNAGGYALIEISHDVFPSFRGQCSQRIAALDCRFHRSFEPAYGIVFDKE
jgi:hypothetical protein